MEPAEQAEDLERQQRALRKKGARRAWFCPGAAFALVGQKFLAVLTFAIHFSVLPALAWLILQPGEVPAYVTLMLLVAALGVWFIEQTEVKKLSPLPPGPWLMAGGFLIGIAIM